MPAQGDDAAVSKKCAILDYNHSTEAATRDPWLGNH
jgi:hypothetical protein